MSDAASRHCLLIVRHAHSSWALPGQRDHQRPLDDRGRREVPVTARAIADGGYVVSAVVCSTAARALETLDGLRPALPADCPERHSDDLYALGIEAYYAEANAASGGCVLIVGHNPMVEDFVSSLCGTGDGDSLRALRYGFPTAGLAIVTFEPGLAQIVPGAGRLRALLVPDRGED
ncbi:histidine phosphatase family protein [Aurantimonas sp. Leaf443]|uniref:SixA phosphatase family protein n=1 Tax=Aurantimonas sp. Leaf443 TaxID=1736378 RepID=UPI0006FCA8A3|nr:histidine phosphatase family protein [Aurantimonas sp. Leaf443]KQT86237.1 hypothetical protein ASG48_06625 [Aurantimonas sp. Leaf443]